MATSVQTEKRGIVGRVTTPLTVSNRADQTEAERGHRQPGDIRSLALDEVIVDTGASTLALPADLITRLGLALRKEVPILTAAGPGTARLYQDAATSLLGH